MENRYYIPEPDDFHIGFEFEVFVDAVKGWRNFSIRDGKHLDFILKEHKDNTVRVKYLNQEDFGELGFIFVEQDDDDMLFRSNRKKLGVSTGDDTYLFIHHSNKHEYTSIWWHENRGFETTIFDGYIKNKSELIKLLKQLRVDYEKLNRDGE